MKKLLLALAMASAILPMTTSVSADPPRQGPPQSQRPQGQRPQGQRPQGQRPQAQRPQAQRPQQRPLSPGINRNRYRPGNRVDNRTGYRGRPGNIYDSRGQYRNPRRLGRNDHIWRGRDGRYYCKRDNGTTGLIIGAGLGALAGHEIAGNGDQTLGAIIGGVAGGVLGREIDRGDLKCR